MPARDYQQACIDLLTGLPPGRYLVQMATGLGKTYTFTHLPRRGRMLILSHREELVRQPLVWFDCPTGVEMAAHTAGPEAEVVSASVQSLVRRLDRYRRGDFQTIIVDEAHHAASKTYKTILGYFQPEKVIGFTATPGRGDRVRLDDVFQRIVFTRDLRWGIEQGHLCDITCRRINIGYDLRAVHTRNGDYAPGELAQAMEGTADAIAEAYRRYGRGPTLIFAVNVHQCQEIARRIPGAQVVTGQTKDRAQIIRRFTAGEIPVLVNCMVFTEGTDLPLVETVVIARPTQSDALYTQMVGRGLRPHPGKERLTLLDCVGAAKPGRLQTAPSLLGLDLAALSPRQQQELEGPLFDLPLKVASLSDSPASWVRNSELVSLWAREQRYELHGVNWFKSPDGRLSLSLLEGRRITLPCPDSLGRVTVGGQQLDYQEALDLVYSRLQADYADQRYLWDRAATARWGKGPASEKQMAVIRRQCRGMELPSQLTKGEASQILNRLSLQWRNTNGRKQKTAQPGV